MSPAFYPWTGQDFALPRTELNVREIVYHLHLPLPDCKMGTWAPSVGVQIPFCWALPRLRAAPSAKGSRGWDHQDGASADEPSPHPAPGGPGPVAEGQTVFLEVAGWQQSLAMGCINEL